MSKDLPWDVEEHTPTEEEARDAEEGKSFELCPEGPGLFKIVEAKAREANWKDWSGVEVSYVLELQESGSPHPPRVFHSVRMFSPHEADWARKVRLGLYKRLELGPLAEFPSFDWRELEGMLVEADVIHREGEDRKTGKPRTFANIDGFIPFSLPPDGGPTPRPASPAASAGDASEYDDL